MYIKRLTEVNFVGLFLWTPLLLGLLFSYSQVSAQIYTQCNKATITEKVTYSKVIDGDTIKLKDGRNIRLIGINTPEIYYDGRPSQAYAQKAKKKLQSLLSQSKTIQLAYDKERYDRYRRTLAYVYLKNGTDIQEQMLAAGYAVSIVVAPNDKNLKCYRHVEAKAKSKGKNIWGLKQYKTRDASELKVPQKRVYGFVEGVVTKQINKSKYLILVLDKKLSIKVSKVAFKQYKSKSLQGKKVKVRGFIYKFRGKSGMTIKHSDNLQVL